MDRKQATIGSALASFLCVLILQTHVFAQTETQGKRVLSAGHSFHVFMPGILVDVAKKAGLKNHQQVGLSSIGGSRVIQHWNLPPEKNKAKEILSAGNADVFTMSPIHLPDEGIENFVKLALEKNPKIQIYVQEFWLPFDVYDVTFKVRPKSVDHNAATGESLSKLHEPYFKSMDEHVMELNKKYKTSNVHVVPVGQAVIALRQKVVEGKVPGVKEQSELFTDPLGHVHAHVRVLSAYCHYAAIYGKSPAGLPVPAGLANVREAEALNRVLQEIAWDAVTSHRLSGVKK